MQYNHTVTSISINKGEEKMITKKQEMNLLVIGSDDDKNTYAVLREWKEGEGKALVIEIYPTLSPSEQYIKNDLSSFHLMNHISELGWREMEVVNLYSKVFSYKPLSRQLKKEDLNTTYIESLLNETDIKEKDVVIAWGTSLDKHKITNEAKFDLLKKLKEKGLEKQIKYLVTEDMGENVSVGVHPLFLGLQHSKSHWMLKQFPLDEEIEKLSKLLAEKPIVKKKGEKKSGYKNSK